MSDPTAPQNPTESPKPTPPPSATVDPPETPKGDLPNDHPLVKALAAQKEQIKSLKEKTARLDEMDEASKSETEKATERAATAEKRAAEAEARALRRDVALEKSLTQDDAALLDAITDEDAMRALATRLASDKKSGSNYVPNEGTNPQSAPNDDAAFGAFLTGRN